MSEEFQYTLTEQELYTALRFTRRRAGNLRLAVQTVLLGLLSVGFIVDFALYRRGGNLFLGLILAAFAVVQWVYPAVSFRREARTLAAEGHAVHLTVSGDTLAVGDVTQPLENCRLQTAGDMLLWQVDRTQFVAIPRRELSQAAWERLCRYAE